MPSGSLMAGTENFDATQWPELWQSAYRLLEQSIAPNQLRAWILPLELMGAEPFENKIRVRFSAINDFSAQWLRDYYRKSIESAISQVSGGPCEVMFQVQEGQQPPIAFETATE